MIRLKTCVSCKIAKERSPRYLFYLIPANSNLYQTRNSQNLVISQFKVCNNFFLNSFFPSALVEWNKLDSDIRNSPSYLTFKKKVLNFIRPRNNDVFNISHPKRLIFLTRRRVGLSHLKERKFKHSFLDILNPICICGLISKHLISFFFTAQDSLMKDKTFCLRLKGSSLTFLERPSLM